jgi:glycosyltransferase involved in cell wall biosynthesis
VQAFNYLITVHNKEALLPRVLSGVAECAGTDARIIVVLDGCTDRSEEIARVFASSGTRDVRLVYAPDVHEIRSINLGLKEAKPGYCVILQDDVILQEPALESIVDDLCEAHNRTLGYISFRLAADVRRTPFLRALREEWRGGRCRVASKIEPINHIGGPQEALDVPRVAYYQFAPRMVGIKSPVCFTPELRSRAAYLDEAFAPYCFDDVDMSLLALKGGLQNGLFSIHFQSELDWGSTRSDKNFSSRKGDLIRLRNRELIWRKHGNFVRKTRHEA